MTRPETHRVDAVLIVVLTDGVIVMQREDDIALHDAVGAFRRSIPRSTEVRT